MSSNVICRMCWVERIRPGDANVDDIPLAVHCDEHCASCDCENAAEGDLEAFHLAQDCPKHVCVAEECVTTREKPCTEHCMGCGFPQLGVPTMDGWHACQWTKERRSESLGTKQTATFGKEMFLSRNILTCKRNPSHKTTTARELKEVREKGWRRLLGDMLWWLPLRIDVIDPREMCPVVECEECFAELYDGGDYQRQAPGILRLQLSQRAQPAHNA